MDLSNALRDGSDALCCTSSKYTCISLKNLLQPLKSSGCSAFAELACIGRLSQYSFGVLQQKEIREATGNLLTAVEKLNLAAKEVRAVVLSCHSFLLIF